MSNKSVSSKATICDFISLATGFDIQTQLELKLNSNRHFANVITVQY